MMSDETEDNMLIAPTQRTLSDYIADQLRNAIMSGQLKPNQRLVEEEIANSMKTSRGPVRDALKILENESLVIRQPHRGAYVTGLSSGDAVEIYTLREALESLAIKFAIKNATNKQIGELEKLVNSMKDLSHKNYTQIEASDLDLQFHHTLCRISGHNRVLVAWESLAPQIHILLLEHKIADPSNLREQGVSWHKRVVEALKQRNTDVALIELQKHLAASYEGMMIAMKEKEETLVTTS